MMVYMHMRLPIGQICAYDREVPVLTHSFRVNS